MCTTANQSKPAVASVMGNPDAHKLSRDDIVVRRAVERADGSVREGDW
jgi:hypothetical protein